MTRARQLTLKDDKDIELKEITENEQKKKVALNGMLQGIVGLLDTLGMGFIFGLFLSPAGMALMPVLAPFVFPLFIALSIGKAALAWQEARIKGFDRRSVFSAIKETLFALIVTTAVVGHFAIPGFAFLSTPILFTAFCGSNVLYNGGSAGFYKNKLNVASNNRNKSEVTKNRGLTTGHLIGVALGLLFLFSVATLFLFPPLGIALSSATITAVASVGVTAAVAAICLTIQGIAGNAKTIKEVEMTERNRVLPDKNKNDSSLTQGQSQTLGSQPAKKNDGGMSPSGSQNKQDGMRQGNHVVIVSQLGMHGSSSSQKKNPLARQSKSAPNSMRFGIRKGSKQD